MKRKIGILCASDEELAPFLEHLTSGRTQERAMLTFYEGELAGVPVVALYSGVCKVNAAVATQLLIDVYAVDAVIIAGAAGGMDPALQIFDTVVCTQTAYHDVAEDILTEFHPWMPSVYFPVDEALLAAARAAAKQWTGGRVAFGPIVSGEQFIAGGRREEINAAFAPLAVDMETAAVAHVCYVNRVPFLAVRTLTDHAGQMGAADFEANCAKAVALAAGFTLALLPLYAQGPEAVS